MSEQITVIPMDTSMMEAQEKALIDTQIATAKAYPRNVVKARDNIVTIVSMDAETAKSCGYSLPRAGSNISGASVHLARIVAQQYGNLRTEMRVSQTDNTHVTGQAMCIDLENNIGIRVEVKKRITNKTGQRFNDDMITVTGLAAAATAFRNAVFNIVPKPLIDAGYKAAQNTLIGDVSDEQKLLAKRKRTIDELSLIHI